MSRGTSDQQRLRWGLGPVLTVAIIGALAVMAFAYGFRGPTATGAQASPAATPAAGTCPSSAATPMAVSPGAVLATPAASPAATLNGTPVAAADATAINSAVANYIACWNAQNIDAIVALSTPHYFATYWGADNSDAAKAALAPIKTLLPNVTLTSTQNAQSYADGRVSVEVQSMLGEYQFRDERWYFVKSGSDWLLDQVDTLPTGPQGDTSIIGVTLDPSAKPPLAPNRDSSAPFPVLDFHFQSTDTKAHAIWIVRLPEANQGTPIAGGAIPSGSEFVGLATIPGTPKADNPSNADVWLTNLVPGTFTFTDLTNPAMTATFTVTPPPPTPTPAAGTPGAGTPAA